MKMIKSDSQISTSILTQDVAVQTETDCKCQIVPKCDHIEIQTDIEFPSIQDEITEGHSKLPSNSDEAKCHVSYSQLKSQLNEGVDPSTFEEQIQNAIRIKNRNLRDLKTFISVESAGDDKDLWIQDALKLCDAEINSPVKIAIIGRLNTGKSLLVSALLNWEINLPASDEATTGRVTRILYSDTPVLRLVEEFDWSERLLHSCKKCNKKIVEKTTLTNENLEKFINLSKDRDKQDSVSLIVEIGIPSKVLKNSIQIIDCPGLGENKALSEVELRILRELHPSIICYVYDHSCGFLLDDGKRLDDINKLLCFDNQFSVQYIVIANKCDDLQENEFDLVSNVSFDSIKTSQSIRKSCKFTRTNHDIDLNIISEGSAEIWLNKTKWFEFDKDRLLPALPLSTGKLLNNKNEQTHDRNNLYWRQFRELQATIAKKIISLSRSILTNLSDYIATSSFNEDKRILMWLKLKSLSVDEDLSQMIENECSDEFTPLHNFEPGYKVFGLKYRDGTIQVTTLSKLNKSFNYYNFETEKRRIFLERNSHLSKHHCHKSSLVYMKPDESIIYLIDKNVPHKRVVDHIDTLFTENAKFQLLNILRQILSQQHYIGVMKPNFRPDNVYFDDNFIIFINRNVPNHLGIPYKLKNNRRYPPFNVQNFIERNHSIYRCWDVIVNFLYSFGWFLWILVENIEISGVAVIETNIMEIMKKINSDCYTKIPKYILHIIKLCLDTKADTGVYDKWVAIVSILCERESSLKTLPPLSASGRKFPLFGNFKKYSYTDEANSKIGQVVFGSQNKGYLERLDDIGWWRFRMADDDFDQWSQIVLKKNVTIYSRFILLPTELGGIVVWLGLIGFSQDNDNEEFRIELYTNDNNVSIEFSLAVELQLKDETILEQRHRFKLKTSLNFAIPDNFYVCMKNCNQHSLPKMNFRFSN